MTDKRDDTGISADEQQTQNAAEFNQRSENTRRDSEKQGKIQQGSEIVHKILQSNQLSRHPQSVEISAIDPQKQAAVDDMRADTELKKVYAYRFI